MATVGQVEERILAKLKEHIPGDWAETWRTEDANYQHYRLGAPGEHLRVTVRGVRVSGTNKLKLTFTCLGEAFRRGQMVAHPLNYQYVGLPDIDKRLDALMGEVAAFRAQQLDEQTDSERRWSEAAALASEIAALTGDEAFVPERQTFDEMEPDILWTAGGRHYRATYGRNGLLRCDLPLTRGELLGVVIRLTETKERGA